jgi:NTP pyrophosphatase (non-canonical NTP hydrolase)
VEIRDIQQRTWANKVAKGFNTSDVALEFGLLTAEVGEAFTAWRQRLPDFGEELADVCLYLVAIAEMNGIDLSAEVERKMAKNEQRVYRRDDRGVQFRVSDA